jgi:hypothetical protein
VSEGWFAVVCEAYNVLCHINVLAFCNAKYMFLDITLTAVAVKTGTDSIIKNAQKAVIFNWHIIFKTGE